jgi:glycosyltransferase involved in cell wall biosynthesis
MTRSNEKASRPERPNIYAEHEIDVAAAGVGNGGQDQQNLYAMMHDAGIYEAQATPQYAVPDCSYFSNELVNRGSGERTGPPMHNRPLRVIHVGQFMFRAGIESWLKSLTRYLDPNVIDFQRCIVTSSISDSKVIRELDVPVEIGGKDSVCRAARDCDILLVSGPAEVADWIKDCPPPVCVGVAHGDAVWTRTILERCAEIWDHVIAVSQAVQEQVCDGFESSVIYNGLDTAHLTRSAPRNEIRARYGFSDADFVIGSVMRLSSEKCPELLIESLAYLPRNCKLLLVGWGPLRPKLLEMANTIAPLRCVITPAEKHLGDFYNSFDAFCLPSRSEGFGLATLESLFSGIPTLTTKTGFAPELLIDGIHYLQCESSGRAIADQILKLVQQPMWAAALAQAGKRRAEEFGFATRMCRDYQSLLTRLWQRYCDSAM